MKFVVAHGITSDNIQMKNHCYQIKSLRLKNTEVFNHKIPFFSKVEKVDICSSFSLQLYVMVIAPIKSFIIEVIAFFNFIEKVAIVPTNQIVILINGF